ncbi:MAG TPA: sulfite exporter TauE/SafE family protein [Gammaproteobacteria bacterium]|nr:sulfite exporter TauE/SafE family protein [Gammaproteobacteria bacterium]
MTFESLTAAFLVGLLGGTHCLGMCGGIVGALSSGLDGQVRESRLRYLGAQLAYNAGRIGSYALAGLLVGAFAGQVGKTGVLEGMPVGRYLAAAVMILLGVYLAGWWHTLLWLEKAGARLWKYLEPLGRRWLPVRHAGQAFLLGLVWGWLPCGMVYAALAMALAAGSAGGGVATMLAFGLGTLPTLLTIGLAYHALRRFLQDPRVRTGAGILVILLGFLMLFAGTGEHGGHMGHHHH